MSGYPISTQEQAAFWDAFQARLLAQINANSPFIVTQATEPTQAEWEAAWVAAGDALPIPAGKRLLWYDGSNLRGEYTVLEGDYYAMVSPLEAPTHMAYPFIRNDNLYAIHQEIPYMAMQSPVSRSILPPLHHWVGNWTGLAKFAEDGSLLERIWEPSPETGIVGNAVSTDGKYRASSAGVYIGAYYADSIDTVVLAQVGRNVATDTFLDGVLFRFRPNASGAKLTANEAAGACVTTEGSESQTSRLGFYLGNGSGTAFNVTAALRKTGGTLVGQQVFNIPANSPIQHYSFTVTNPASVTNVWVEFTFDAAISPPNWLYMAGVYWRPTDSSPLTWDGCFTFGEFSLPVESDWIFSNVTVESNALDRYVPYFLTLKKNLTSGVETQIGVFRSPLWETSLPDVTFKKSTSVFADTNGDVFILTPKTVVGWADDAWNGIYRLDAASKTVVQVYFDDVTPPTRVLTDPINRKFILGYGDRQEAKIINFDGSGETTITGLYMPTLVYDGKVFGRPLGLGWPNTLANQIKVWDIATGAYVNYADVTPYPNFDAERRLFVDEQPTFAETQQGEGGSQIPSVALAPLNDVLPVELLGYSTAGRYLAIYGNPELTKGRSRSAAIVADDGLTGRVRRLGVYTVPGPDYWVLHDLVMDTDFDEVNFDLSGFDLSNHEVLVILLDNNCTTAHDDVTLRFNSDAGAGRYWTSYSRTSGSAAPTRSFTSSQTAITLPAANSVYPGTYTLFIPNHQSDETKTLVVIGGRHLALTTTNVQQLIASAGWRGTDPVTAIRVGTVTAGRKLRAGGRITVAALKTRGRLNNDAFFTPSVA